MSEFCEETPPTLFNVVPSPRDDRDWNCDVLHDKTVKLPSTLDLRSKIPGVRNQGSQGTCAAQVASCMKEWQERKNVDLKGYMSPQFIYNNRVNAESSGMFGRDVMSILKNKGCCTEDDYKYGTVEAASDIKEEVLKAAENFKIRGYARIYKSDTLKRALVMNGPCYISFPVYNLTNRMWEQHEGEKKLGGHAMTVVGYDKKGFIIRNSWGKFWENGGYCSYPFEDWGAHYEVWTTVDDLTSKPVPSKNMCVRLGRYLLSSKEKKKNDLDMKDIYEEKKEEVLEEGDGDEDEKEEKEEEKPKKKK